MKNDKFKILDLINKVKMQTADIAAEASKYLSLSDLWEILSSISPGHLTGVLSLIALMLFSMDSLQAVPVDTLRAPMQQMKNEMWSYLYPVQIASVVVGAAFSLMKQSIMPFGIGAGITVAANFLEKVIGDGSAALI